MSTPPSHPPPGARFFLLVDAHNVIFADPALAALHGRQPASARRELVARLERHQDATGVRIVAVFDGGSSNRATAETSGGQGIQVFYPRQGQSADAIIERLVLKYAAIHHLTVATNDHLVRTAAVAAGAATMDAAALFEELGRGEREMGETLKNLRRSRR
jgi:predicted RNA-binding protein with PIN domain